MKIPMDRLAPETLLALMEEFITREGTDYGETELELPEKVKRLHQQIASGKVVIVFDEVSESVLLLTAEAYRETLA